MVRARGESRSSRVNIWHPDSAAWTHRPGTTSADGIAVVGHDGWIFIKTARTRRPSRWWLAQVFTEVHFLWWPYGWDPGYLRDVGARVAVVQTAERFVGRVPLHRVDVGAWARDSIGSGSPGEP